MTAALLLPRSQVVLQGVSWATYQSLMRDLESAPGKRLTYDQGTLEIKVPLPPHESYKKLMGRMVEVTTEEYVARSIACGNAPIRLQSI